jgi:hypothetical protein
MRRILSVLLIVLLISTVMMSCASTDRVERMNRIKEGDTQIDTTASAVSEATEIISVEPDIPIEEPVVEEEESDPSNWLSALGSIKGLNVKSYRLRGVGPDGASFDWIEVKGPKIALSDIRRGEWTLYAEAIGEDGTVVATGSLTTFLSDSTPLGTLLLSEEVGEGDVSCNFTWNTKQVLYPSVEIYMKKVDGNFVARDKSEIRIIENGSAKWTVKDVPAGTYVVRAILKDEGTVVSGVAAALRVVNGKESVGNCQFTVGKLSTVYGISLEESPLDTVEGAIVLDNGVLSFASDVEQVVYTWFMDGEVLPSCTEQSIDIESLNLKKGFYRFDCVACNAEGETSINTISAFIYVDGDITLAVSEADADGHSGDAPEGFTKIKIDPEAKEEITELYEEEITMEKIENLIETLPSEAVDKAIDAVNSDASLSTLPEDAKASALYDRLKEEEEILKNAVKTLESGIITMPAEITGESETPAEAEPVVEVEAADEPVIEESAPEAVAPELIVFTPEN